MTLKGFLLVIAFILSNLFQITPSESEPTWQCDDVDAEGTAPW